MQSKLTDLASAVREHVFDGDAIFLSGMQHGEPSAAVHEILRQGRTDLTLIPQLPESSQLLITEGRVRRLLTGYTSILYPRRGVLASRAADRKFQLVEFSHGALYLALVAGQMGLPFLPSTALVGSDYLTINQEYFELISSPFDGGPVAAVRALRPDIAVIHVQRADKYGNAQKKGSLGMDVVGAHASKRVIVTAEEIVESRVIKADPEATTIPGFLVDAVVEVPFGAWPQHLSGAYGDDMRTWMGLLGNDEGYDSFLNDFVYGVRDRAEFLDRLTNRFGPEHLAALRAAAQHPNEALEMRMTSR